MTASAVLIGTAAALAPFAGADWRAQGLSVKGTCVIGAGETPTPPLLRASHWGALDLSPLGVEAVVLVDPPSANAARAALGCAAAAHLRAFISIAGRVRPLSLSDLVGASQDSVDWDRIRERIAGKRVLITGGGGSIGAELARRVAELDPARLCLLDSSEFNLFQISLDLPGAALALADVRDARAVKRWMDRERPEIVFHAAALKQVPLVEMFPSEGVLTNLGGLRHVAEAAHDLGADLIFVSTDKAVDPSGTMGASKRLGEMYCQSLDRRGAERAIPVRLGNVLGSTGSVAPIFEAQFAAGGPLTVTDAAVTRYFLSIPQAAEALLQAAATGLSADAPRGAALVIDMGEPLPVVELARDVIRLNGLRPEIDMPITFVGLRPGEKLHEQLIGEDEAAVVCGGAGVTAAVSPQRGLAELKEIIDRLLLLAREGADEAVVSELFAALRIETRPRANLAASA